MKIGIDAKWFFEGPVSNQVVIRNLVAGMAADNRGHELFFFLNRKHRHLPFPHEGKNVHCVYVWAGNNLLSNVFLLPILGKRLGLDGILYQNFASFFGPKRWLYIHDVIFEEFPEFFSLPERLYFSFMPFLARFSSKIATISRHEQERLRRLGIAGGKEIRHFHHGKEAAFKPKNEHNPAMLQKVKEKYQLPEHFLLYTGRINARKNIFRLLQAHESCHSDMPMVLVGSPEWKNEPGLADLLNRLKREGKIILCGKVPWDDLPLIMCQARAFCFLSLAEGFGLPVLEAMASGVPVLTSEHSAMEEICGDAAIVANPLDTGSIEAGMLRLIQNPDLRSKLSEAGIKRAAQFDWQKTSNALLDWLGHG
jgi:glycosyltransferase involved in cell wall biosynthesis